MVKRIIDCISCIVFSLIVIYEAAIGLLQLLGLSHSNHAFYKMTGTMDNPGPYGGILAISMAVIISSLILYRQTPVIKALAMTSIILGAIALPATCSRAAFLSLAIALYILFRKESNLTLYLKRKRGLRICTIAIVCILTVYLFYLKKESALGRLHIWRIEFKALLENPLTGTGANTVMGTYGLTQADFFKEKQRSPLTTRLAGCPQYAFNEYMKVGIEYGIPAMTLLTLITVLLIIASVKYRTPIGYGLIALSIFSFFSYPIEAIFKKEPSIELQKGHTYVQNGLYKEAIQILEPQFTFYSKDYKFLYDLGYALHKEHRYIESNTYLNIGAKYSSDPMFHNIIGKNHEAMADYERARNEYILAHYMIPSRIYPLYLLMKMESRIGNTGEAIIIGETIQNMPYNSSHRTMVNLRRESAYLLDSLKQVR